MGQHFISAPTQLRKNTAELSNYGQTQLSCASLQKRERRGPAKVQMVSSYVEGANVLQTHAYHGPAPSTFTQHLSKGAALESLCCSCSAMPEAQHGDVLPPWQRVELCLPSVFICPNLLNQFYSCLAPITVDCDI